jgi:hypothetical protein
MIGTNNNQSTDMSELEKEVAKKNNTSFSKKFLNIFTRKNSADLLDPSNPDKKKPRKGSIFQLRKKSSTTPLVEGIPTITKETP